MSSNGLNNNCSIRNQEAYSNAIILNNLGCVLLQSGARNEAFATFRDAVDTLQSSSQVVQGPSFDNGTAKISTALGKLRATQRLHQRQDCVSVIGYEDEPMRNLVFETAFGDPMYVAFTLRPHQAAPTRDPDTDSAILLHNFALSHLVLAKHGLLRERDAHKGALYIFRVAFKVLFQKLEGMINGEGYVSDHDSPLFDNFCGAVTVVLANLVYTLNHQGFDRAARDGFLQLREFLQNFSQADHCPLFGRITAAAAA
eukprot:scaffold6986_cov190-Amphora_coffeaeformis.AAC.2